MENDREDLYRGKRIDNGEWIEGSRIILNSRCFIVNDTISDLSDGYIQCSTKKECSGIFHKINGVVEVIPETVGQYTGLTDKNGKKIFEGDIIKTHYKNAKKNEFIEDVVFLYGKFMSHKVIYGSHQYMAICAPHEKHLKIDKSVYMDSCEVIGNIHDNPGQEVSE